MMLHLFSLAVLFGELTSKSAVGFAPTSLNGSLIKWTATRGFLSQSTRRYQSNDEDEELGESTDMPRLLGSVDFARRRGEISAESDGDNPVVSENRILVISDEQKVNTGCVQPLCFT
jgi:hypothetical protein